MRVAQGIAGLAVAAALSAAAPAEEALAGRWSIQGTRTVFRIEPCGPEVCGVLESSGRILREPDARDVRNPDPRLRDRPLKGLRALSGLTPTGPHAWRGRLYSPGAGSTVDVAVTEVDADTLTARGCLAPLLCRTDTLKRLR